MTRSVLDKSRWPASHVGGPASPCLGRAATLSCQFDPPMHRLWIQHLRLLLEVGGGCTRVSHIERTKVVGRPAHALAGQPLPCGLSPTGCSSNALDHVSMAVTLAWHAHIPKDHTCLTGRPESWLGGRPSVFCPRSLDTPS